MICRYLLIATLFFISTALASADISSLTLSHDVVPREIWTLESGKSPTESTVTLTIEDNATIDNIELVLAIDDSSSTRSSKPKYKRIRNSAIKNFVGMMDPKKDKIGLFIWNCRVDYDIKNVTRIISLTNNFLEVNNTMDENGYSDEMPPGGALNGSINILKNGGSDTRKFIILYSDGNDDHIGDQATNDAKNERIIIDVIGIEGREGVNTTRLKKIANDTGGDFYHSYYDSLEATYREIYENITMRRNTITTIENIALSYALPAEINISNYTIKPENEYEKDDGIKVLTWNVGTISQSKSWNVSFNVSTQKAGKFGLGNGTGSGMNYTGYDEIPIEIKGIILIVQSNLPPTIANLTATPPSPQPNGTRVKWVANANDSEDDPLVYQFQLNGADQTGWTSDNTWTWKTSSADVGKNEVEVWVRDGLHNGSEAYDDNKTAVFTIHENEPPEITSLKATPPSHQPSETVVEWTANATDPEGDDIVYQFLLNRADQTGWTSDNTWTWNTSPADIGWNQVQVRVRDNQHEGLKRYDDVKIVEYRIWNKTQGELTWVGGSYSITDNTTNVTVIKEILPNGRGTSPDIRLTVQMPEIANNNTDSVPGMLNPEGRPIARDVVVKETILPYLNVTGWEIDEASGQIVNKTVYQNGTTTLIWRIGEMKSNESATMILHTAFNLILQPEVNDTVHGLSYDAYIESPTSKVVYSWLLGDKDEERIIDLPAGKIRIT